MGVVRISVSLDQDMVRRMEDFMAARGITNRSSLVMAALESYLSEHVAVEGAEGSLYGAVAVFYETHEHEAEHAVTESQHGFLDIVVGAFHIHVSRDRCLELIVVKGPASRVRKLIERLSKARGVLGVKPVVYKL